MKMVMSEKVYLICKWMCMVCIPALTTFYVVLDKCFGWNHAEVVATISAALCAMIGSLIGVSSAEYYSEKKADQTILADEDDGK